MDNCSTTSISNRRQSEKYSCFSKNSPCSEHLQKTVHEPQEAERQEITKDFKKDFSFHSEKRLLFEQSPKARDCNISTENRLHTLEGFSTHKVKTHENKLTRPKCRKRIYGIHPSKNPVEPIVLSSDEENEASSDSETAQILHLSPTQYLPSDKKEAECPLAERLALQEGENKKVEQNLMYDDQLRRSKMGVISLRKDEKTKPILEIEFRTVYFGKKKGRSKGRLKVTKSCYQLSTHSGLYQHVKRQLVQCQI